jgi:hypothetical protein
MRLILLESILLLSSEMENVSRATWLTPEVGFIRSVFCDWQSIVKIVNYSLIDDMKLKSVHFLVFLCPSSLSRSLRFLSTDETPERERGRKK